jgi:hypothetical protein
MSYRVMRRIYAGGNRDEPILEYSDFEGASTNGNH